MFLLLLHTSVRNSWLKIQGSSKITFHPCTSHLPVSFYTCSLPPYVLLSVQIAEPCKWHFPGFLEKWLPARFGCWEALEEGVEGERRGEANVFFFPLFLPGERSPSLTTCPSWFILSVGQFLPLWSNVLSSSFWALVTFFLLSVCCQSWSSSYFLLLQIFGWPYCSFFCFSTYPNFCNYFPV